MATVVACLAVLTSVPGVAAIDVTDMRKLVGKKCDHLEYMLGKPRDVRTSVDRIDQYGWKKMTTEVWLYDDATAVCVDGRVASVNVTRTVTPKPATPSQENAPGSMTISPPMAGPSVVDTRPRLAADRKTLVLLDEIHEPGRRHQAEITLTMDARAGTRQIRMSGQGLGRLQKVHIACDVGAAREIPLSSFGESAERNMATFVIADDTVATVLDASTCFISINGSLLAIPRDLASVVWR